LESTPNDFDLNTVLNRPLNIAPEIVGCFSETIGERQKIDMFMLAINIFRIATEEIPFSNTYSTYMSRIRELFEGTYLQKVRTKWPALAPFLDPDPKKRSCDIERLKRVVATRPFVEK
jgi:hypothetical protein